MLRDDEGGIAGVSSRNVCKEMLENNRNINKLKEWKSKSTEYFQESEIRSIGLYFQGLKRNHN